MALRRLAVMVFLMMGLSVVLNPAEAQTNNAACPALVEMALTQVGNNCADMGRNTACYGFNQLTARFNQAVDGNYFQKPSDRVELGILSSIQTAPLDLDNDQWGIAVMNVQANVPDTLPGQAVTFLLLGDSEIEDAVITDSTVPAVTVILQTAADLRSSAQPTSGTIGKLAAGTVVDADAISSDGASIRLVLNEATGWVSRDSVNPNPTLDRLPVVSSNSDSPMQSFYFRTRTGSDLQCSQTPSALVVQSPQGIKVNLTANGADIQLGSLITLQVLPDGRTMQLTTLEGEAILNPGAPDEVRVPAGSTTTRCLSEPQDLGIDGRANDLMVGGDCSWEQPRSATYLELEVGQTGQAIIDRLGLTQIETPAPTETPVAGEPTAQPTAAPQPPTECPVGTNINHVVVSGENLFRISVRYKTSMGAIMAANGITNAERIYTGQNLVIPCGVDTGLPTVPQQPPTNPQPPDVPSVPGVDCSTFRATSPLDGLNYGSNTFYWDGLAAANGYRVNIYGIDEARGRLVRSFEQQGTATNLTADITIETTGYGFSFAWDVQALYNGVVLCTSARTTVPRGAPNDSSGSVAATPVPVPTATMTPPPPPPPFTATWSCSALTPNTFKVDYFNAPAGTSSVTVNYSIISGGVTFGPITGTVPPVSGTVFFNSTGPGVVTAGTITANPSATTLPLPGTLGC
ncbi:MAG: LysM peptidoglycan-binding domain-containing protein [Chloroflexi bacterium]|nr:LysM peptidoglycan-binding domain-containing protein [Chloroflexota bacterium]MCC6893706.1 LysM peptidoglycan-binding domain-containing protein [Anaerolineae bacterium]